MLLPTRASGTTVLMLAKLKTFALVGIEAVTVEVEVDTSAGPPKMVLVGLPVHGKLTLDRKNGRAGPLLDS